jgi:glutamate N-acetyltransferase/amino-acid N-acetyltransferase
MTPEAWSKASNHALGMLIRGELKELLEKISNLVKAAIFGNDPNWGRIISAVGTVPEKVAPYDPLALDVTVNGVQVCRAGGVGQPRELVDLASAREVRIEVDLHAGDATATVWTNDLTHDYVHENSAYSS